MNALSEIKQNIRRIAGNNNANRTLFTAKVVSVDGEVCNVALDGLTLTDVRLRAVVNGENSKMLISPKVNSYVLVADLSGELTHLVVVAFSEIDKIEINAETEIVINGGQWEGLVKIQQLTEKLNALVDWCKNHKHSGVITAVSGGGGAPAVGTSGNSAVPTSQPDEFDKSDYEDTNVKH